MIETFKAIQAKFNATAALTAIFSQGCYSTTDARKRALPVCTVKVDSSQREKNTGKTARVNDRVRFQCWTTYGDTAAAAVDAIVAAFDEQPLTMASGASFMRCSFQTYDIDIEDEDVWQANVTFNIEYWFDNA